MRVPPGITTNNPMMLANEGVEYEGGLEPHDGLLVFDTQLHGVTAGLIYARTMVYGKGCDTLERFLVDQPYVTAGMMALAILPNGPLHLDNPDRLIGWARFVIRHENGTRDDGTMWITDETIRQAATLAMALTLDLPNSVAS